MNIRALSALWPLFSARTVCSWSQEPSFISHQTIVWRHSWRRTTCFRTNCPHNSPFITTLLSLSLYHRFFQPKLSWLSRVAPTAIKWSNSMDLRATYKALFKILLATNVRLRWSTMSHFTGSAMNASQLTSPLHFATSACSKTPRHFPTHLREKSQLFRCRQRRSLHWSTSELDHQYVEFPYQCSCLFDRFNKFQEMIITLKSNVN